MKYCTRMIFLFVLGVGYTFNLYFLTADPEVRQYQWINKVGVVIPHLGAVMGYVYVIDKTLYLKDIK